MSDKLEFRCPRGTLEVWGEVDGCRVVVDSALVVDALRSAGWTCCDPGSPEAWLVEDERTPGTVLMHRVFNAAKRARKVATTRSWQTERPHRAVRYVRATGDK